MKPLIIFCFLLFLLGVLAFLAQMWFDVWSADTFIKLLITDGALLAIVGVYAFLVSENRQTDKVNSGDKLDQ